METERNKTRCTIPPYQTKPIEIAFRCLCYIPREKSNFLSKVVAQVPREESSPSLARHFRCSSGKTSNVTRARGRSINLEERPIGKKRTRGVTGYRLDGRSIRKGQWKRIVVAVVARTSLPDGKREPGRKLRKLAAAGASDYANSLTNVSCNQTAIYQSINSTNRTIYGHNNRRCLLPCSFPLVFSCLSLRLLRVPLHFFHSLLVSFRRALGQYQRGNFNL